jgi:hypothetical protein
LGSSIPSTSINSVVLFFSFFKKNLYLDAGLSKKHDVAKRGLVWLNQFGTIGTFLKMISN